MRKDKNSWGKSMANTNNAPDLERKRLEVLDLAHSLIQSVNDKEWLDKLNIAQVNAFRDFFDV